jgi:hypothetical protein
MICGEWSPKPGKYRAYCFKHYKHAGSHLARLNGNVLFAWSTP